MPYSYQVAGLIGIADYVFQKVLLLNLDKLYFQFVLLCKLQILVDALQSQVYRLWSEVLHQVAFISQQILLVHFLIVSKEIVYRPHIRCHGVLCQISFGKMIFEFCYHITLINNEYGNNIRYSCYDMGWFEANPS